MWVRFSPEANNIPRWWYNDEYILQFFSPHLINLNQTLIFTKTSSFVFVSTFTSSCWILRLTLPAIRSTRGILIWIPEFRTLWNFPKRSTIAALCCFTVNTPSNKSASTITIIIGVVMVKFYWKTNIKRTVLMKRLQLFDQSQFFVEELLTNTNNRYIFVPYINL